MHTMIKRISFLAFIILIYVLPLAAFAQDTGGQFWVQAFEDRNGNAQHDAGEPFLTRGVSVDLLNADGIIMATGKLDDAPYASQGYIGFLYLSPGSYTAEITSPDLSPTTPQRIEFTIEQGASQPVKAMFGAERAAAETAATPISTSPLLNSELARIALAGFGGLLVVILMGALGLVIYALVLRPRAPKDVRRTTGMVPAVRVYEAAGDARFAEPPPRRTDTGRVDKSPRGTAAARLAGDLGRGDEGYRSETSPLDQPFQRPADTDSLE